VKEEEEENEEEEGDDANDYLGYVAYFTENAKEEGRVDELPLMPGTWMRRMRLGWP
jgi:hypothetical protein